MADSKQAFLDLVAKDNPIRLTKDDVIFGSVTDDNERSNVTLTANPEGRYTRSVTFDYRRLRLSSLFGFFQPKVQAPTTEVPSVDVFIALVAAQYGITFEPEVLTITAKTTEEGHYYVVEAKDTSLVYSDQATFRLDFPKIDISTVIGGDSTNFVYPTVQAAGVLVPKADALVYSGGWLVSEAAVDLGELLVGNTATDNLRWLISTLSGEDWVSIKNTETEHNLFGSLVEHNGPVAEYPLIAESAVSILIPPTATRVLALRLSDLWCRDYTGVLTIYY